jgi:hypothetical protein
MKSSAHCGGDKSGKGSGGGNPPHGGSGASPLSPSTQLPGTLIGFDVDDHTWRYIENKDILPRLREPIYKTGYCVAPIHATPRYSAVMEYVVMFSRFNEESEEWEYVILPKSTTDYNWISESELRSTALDPRLPRLG